MLTDMDKRLLRRWQAEPSLSPSELAEACGLPRATVTRRIARLQETGIVRGLSGEINWPALGYAVEVSLRITVDKTQPRAFDEMIAAARAIPEVLEIQTFLGRVDVRLSVIARDMDHYQQVYRRDILALPHIADIEALMHVSRIKSDRTLPL